MRKLFLFIAALMVSIVTMAADFSAVCSSGQTLYYNIIDAVNHTCRVTAGDVKPTGNLVIPGSVVNPDDAITYTVEGIGDNAFSDCYGLTGVTFPTDATFTYIGVDASLAFSFYECYGIKSLVIPDNVTSIGGQAFREMGITSVSFGSGVTTLSDGIFGWCSSLKRVVLPNTITTLKGNCFQSSGVKYVELGNAMANNLKASAFGSTSPYYCKTSIDTIVINTVTPPTVSGTFYSELANRCILYVPVGSKAAYKAADGWKDLKYILEKGEELTMCDITVSGGYTSELEAVTFDLNGSAMSSSSFSFKVVEGETFTIKAKFGNKYYGLKQVMLGETDVTDQFDANNEATLTATASATLSFTYEQKIHPYDFSEVIPSGQTLFFKIIDAVNHKVAICNQTGGRSTSGNVSKSYDSNTTKPSGALVIPTSITHDEVLYSVTEVDTLAFNECYYLTSLTIPEGITAIRAAAFHDTYLGTNTELVIPQSCKRIEYGAFRGCRYNAVNPGGAEVIEEYAFLYCPLTELKSSSALRELGPSLCQSSSLTTVGLGENVEWVSPSAFAQCSNLATVTCLATTPPAVKWNGPSGSAATNWSYYDPSTAILYVPWSADHSVLAAYESAACWTLFGTISEISETPSALDDVVLEDKAEKRIIDGQLLIIRNGKVFNANGAQLR